jgi:hypothetical protein
VLLDLLAVVDNTRFTQVHVNLLVVNLGVIDSNTSVLLDEVLDQSDGSSFTGITCVLLESKSKDSNFLVRDGVEQGGNDVANESLLLVLVHNNNLVPVSGNLGKMELFRKVDKVKNVLLEARTTKTNRRLQKLGSDTAITTASICDLINISSSSLAKSREGIDGGNTLSEKSISSLVRRMI